MIFTSVGLLQGGAVEADVSYSEFTEVDERSPRTSRSDSNESAKQSSQFKGLVKLDAKYFRPFFTRKFTQKVVN